LIAISDAASTEERRRIEQSSQNFIMFSIHMLALSATDFDKHHHSKTKTATNFDIVPAILQVFIDSRSIMSVNFDVVALPITLWASHFH
jgi:hypothetical protein